MQGRRREPGNEARSSTVADVVTRYVCIVVVFVACSIRRESLNKLYHKSGNKGMR